MSRAPADAHRPARADAHRPARVVVVGAGLGGLAAACQLAGRGHDVVVVDRAALPGGRAGRWDAAGFHFDTGPSVVTMADVLADTFRSAGAHLEDHLTLHRLDPAYRACFADGSELRVRADRDAMAAEVESVCGSGEADGFDRFVSWTTELFRHEYRSFIDRDVRTIGHLLNRPRDLAALVRLGAFRRLQGQVDRYFADERLRRLFSFQALYAGLSPLQALALYAVIAYMDTVAGVWAVEGGVHAVPAALAAAAEKAGAQLRLGTNVERIDAGAPCAVHTSAGTLTADAVVVNADLPIAYETLMAVQAPRRVRRARFSPSCAVWLLGTDAVGGTPPFAHHNIHFGAEWASAFADVLYRGRPMHDPSRLVTVASVSDSTLAPPDSHSLFILEPLPNLQTGPPGWAGAPSQLDALTERTLDWATAAGYLTGTVRASRAIGPREWAAQGLKAGTPFSLDHRFTQSGPFRPHLQDRRLPGVVFVGCGTRPGVGVPLVLISGRLAADAVEASLAA